MAPARGASGLLSRSTSGTVFGPGFWDNQNDILKTYPVIKFCSSMSVVPLGADRCMACELLFFASFLSGR